MIAVIQRAQNASVTIDSNIKSSISYGLVILLGIEDADTEEDIDWLTRKIVNLRIFDDAIQCVRAQTSGVAGRELLQNIVRRNAPGPAQMIIEDQGRHGLDVLFPGRFREKGSVDDLHPEFITCPGQ